MEKKHPYRTYKTISNSELNSILSLHHEWLRSEGKAGKQGKLRKTNLTKQSLICLDLRKFDFSESDFAYSDLTGSNLSGAMLSSCNFYKADLDDCMFSGANAPNSTFARASLRRANFQAANLRAANLAFANLSDSDLNSATLNQADIRSATLTNSILRRSKLEGARLNNANLYKVDFSKANLINSNMSGANATGVALFEAQTTNWVISGITCDYIYNDEDKRLRIPQGRNFVENEFVDLFESLPTIEYHFANGFSPIDPILLSKVLQSINQDYPMMNMRWLDITARGLHPSARFSVSHKGDTEHAIQLLVSRYEELREAVSGKIFNITVNSGGHMTIGEINISGNLINSGIIGDNGTITHLNSTTASRDGVEVNVNDHSGINKEQVEALLNAIHALTAKQSNDLNYPSISILKEVKKEIQLLPAKGVRALSTATCEWIKENASTLISTGINGLPEAISKITSLMR